MNKSVSVNIKKPVFSIDPKIKKWQEENWEKFKKWIETKGGSFNEETDRIVHPKGTYEITFTPVK